MTAHALTSDNLPKHLQKRALGRAAAAEYLQVRWCLRIAPATLARKASVGGGPGFHKAMNSVMYPVDELDRWATEQLGPMHMSTSGHGRR